MVTEKIEQYCKNKDIEKALKKEISSLADEIKAYMESTNEERLEGGDYAVKLTHKVVDEINEQAMLEAVKVHWKKANGRKKCPFIRTVEVLDADALEGAIYRGEIDNDLIAELGKCKTTKTQLMLTYSKKKEAK